MNTIQRYTKKRENGTNGTAVTSADTKIGYAPETGEPAAFILGDINAFPEGQEFLEDWYGTAEHVADSLIYNTMQHADGDTADIVVNHHPGTYSDNGWNGNPGQWLERDKKTLYAEIMDHPAVGDVYDVVDPEQHLSVDGGDIYVDGTPVDGYINLHDRGEHLLRALDYDTEAIAKGANPPTAVWNRELEAYTGKHALLDTVEDLAQDVEHVYTPRFETVETVEDVIRFGFDLYGDDWLTEPRRDETVILKTDPDATWGDAVLAFDPTEIVDELEARKRESYGGTPYPEEIAEDVLVVQAQREEDRVSGMNNRPDNHQLLSYENDTWTIMQQDPDTGDYIPGTGIVEEAIAGAVERDGTTYHIGTVDGRPYDLVPLSVTDPGTGRGTLRAVTVRTANSENLNVNRNGDGLDRFGVHPLKDAYPAFLENELAEDAGHSIPLQEINDLLEDTAELITTTRNQTAYDAERHLEHGDL